MNVIACVRRVSAPLFRISKCLAKENNIAVINSRSLYLATAPLLNVPVSTNRNVTRDNVAPVKLQVNLCRMYGHGVHQDRHMLTERILLVLRLYDKINPEKLTLESQFTKDLGLDSLDHVELIMAIEDEFGFEIPDQDAERLHSPGDIVQYLCDKLDVFD